jgi:hypothetical protein
MISLLIKVYDSIMKNRAGGPFLLMLVSIVGSTGVYLATDKLFSILINDQLVMSSRLVKSVLLTPFGIAYSIAYDPLINLFFLLILSVAIYRISWNKTVLIRNKRYMYIGSLSVYQSFDEIRWVVCWVILTLNLSYFYFYHFLYPESFNQTAESIYRYSCVLASIFWVLLAVRMIITIQEWLFFLNGYAVLKDTKEYSQVHQLLDDHDSEEFVLNGSEITFGLEKCIDNGLFEIRGAESIRQVKETDQVRIRVKKTMKEIYKEKETILSEGLFLDNYL